MPNGQLAYAPTGLLIGGIGQQPSSARFPGQVEDAENWDFTVQNGAIKRTGTSWIRTVPNTDSRFAAGNTYRLHGIARTPAEQYLIMYGRTGSTMRLVVLEGQGNNPEPGPEATVTFGTGAQAYLDSGSATADDLRFVTIADGTIIVNTKVATGLLTSPPYTLSRTYADTDIMVVSGPANGTYHRALKDGELLEAGYYLYNDNAGGRTFPRYEIKQNTFAYTGWDECNTRDWGNASSDPKVWRMAFRRVPLTVTGAAVALVTGDTYTITLAGAFASYTFVDGDMVRVTGGTGVAFPASNTNGYLTVISKDSNDQITVVSAGTGPAYSPGRSASLIGATTANIDGVGREYEVSRSFASDITGGKIVTMDDIAEAWNSEFRAQGETDVLVAWVPAASGPGGIFRVTGPWAGADAIIWNDVRPMTGLNSAGDLTLGDRPFTNKPAAFTITNGTGTAATIRVPLASRWTKVAPPSQPEYQPDPAKMPLLLKRVTFSGIHTPTPTPATFTLERIAWTVRGDGDEISNAAPKLLSTAQAISDVAFIDGRLVFSGGPYVMESGSNRLYDFYKAKADTLADDDRIERTLPSNTAHLTVLQRTLLVGCEDGQLFQSVPVSDEARTPKSVSVDRVSSAQIVPETKPVTMNQRAYTYTRKIGSRSGRVQAGIFEIERGDLAVAASSFDVSAQVPYVFADRGARMVSVEAENIIMVHAPTGASDDHFIWVWRTSYQPGGERIQSAWTRYTMQPEDKILDICVIPDGVMVLSESVQGYTDPAAPRVAQWVIERWRFEPDPNTIYAPWAATAQALGASRMDRRCRVLSIFNDPANPSAPTQVTLASDNHYIDTIVNFSNGDWYPLTRTGPSTGTIPRTSDTSLAAGRRYKSRMVLTEPYVRSQAGTLPASPFHIHDIVVRFRRAMSLTVEMFSKVRNAVFRRESLRPRFGVNAFYEEGRLAAGPGGDASDVRIAIESDGPWSATVPMVQVTGEDTHHY